jgi:hypothetical protein
MMKQVSYNLHTDKLSNNSAFYYKIIQDIREWSMLLCTYRTERKTYLILVTCIITQDNQQ